MAAPDRTRRDNIGLAHDIAKILEAHGVNEVEAGVIMSMALGIYVEAQPNSHREVLPLVAAMESVAKQVFDAMREARHRAPAHA